MDLSASDRVELMQLIAGCNHAFDDRDGERWANAFTQDGVFQDTDQREVKGREALVRMLRELAPRSTRRWTCNLLIEPGRGGQALARASFAQLFENQIELIGSCMDEFEKRDGKWQLTRRRLIAEST